MSTLATAGLDLYNHSPGNAPDDYETTITTRSHHDRLDTLAVVRLPKPRSQIRPPADRSGLSGAAHA